MEEENPSSECKNLSTDHPLENSTRMNSCRLCSTWMTINSPSLYLPVYLSPPSSSQQPTPLVFSSPNFPESPPLSYQRKATKRFGFGYGVSNVILSLTKSMFVDEEGVYRISINTMKEMEKKDGNLVFLQEKLSLFIQMKQAIDLPFALTSTSKWNKINLKDLGHRLLNN